MGRRLLICGEAGANSPHWPREGGCGPPVGWLECHPGAAQHISAVLGFLALPGMTHHNGKWIQQLKSRTRLGFAGGDDAGDSGEVGDGVDVVPSGEQGHDGLRLGVADLHEEPAAGTERLKGLRDETANDIESLVSGEDGNVRLIVLDHILHLVGFVESDVGRVGDDEVEGGVARDVGENVAQGEAYASAEALGVAASDVESFGREIDGVNLGVGQFAGEGDGDGSRSGANVDDFEAWAERKVVDEIEDGFDEVLGLRAWDEHGGGDEKVGAPELLVSGEVLQGLSGGAASDELVVLHLLGGGQLALGVGVEVGAVALQHMKDENLGADARLCDSCGFELGDGRVEGLAELHGFIVRRIEMEGRMWRRGVKPSLG